jgi:amino-acid N-acetyltransferase
MPNVAEQPQSAVEAFDEKQFYLDEFRGRTLLFSIPVTELEHDADYECFAAMVRELLTNNTRVIVLIGARNQARSDPVMRRLQRRLGPLIFRDETILLFPQRGARSAAFSEVPIDAFTTPASASLLLSGVWTTLRRGPLFVGVIASANADVTKAIAQQVAVRLRVHKLVLIHPDGGIVGSDGTPLSFMDEAMLTALLAAGEAEWAGLAERRPALEAARAALLGGVASVNLCTLAGAPRELFTYTGSGTLCTKADYCTIQRLGIDDFEEVERLIERGQREGLLKLRTAEEIAVMLINGYGATIGAHHLAGICALVTQPYVSERAGEIVGLYTITRFKGEGVGGRLVARVLDDARRAGLAYVFACTTEERAQGFFERQGFRRTSTGDVPAAKWESYDPQRRTQVAVFRFDLR